MRQQPPNREIGFVSSSFSFRVVRASGRGEAAWACEGTSSSTLGLPGASKYVRRVLVGDHLLLTGVRVLRVLGLLLKARGHETADRRAGFKVFDVVRTQTHCFSCGFQGF